MNDTPLNYPVEITRPDPSTMLRFLAKVWVSPSGCWMWTGALDGAGYGRFRWNGSLKGIGAHRCSYAIFHGKVPAGMTVDHECQTLRCVNPDHLRLMTVGENSSDANYRRYSSDEPVCTEVSDPSDKVPF